MRSKSLLDYLKPPRGFRLTKSGRIFFVFLFGIILAAMATGNNLLFLILACLLSFMIVSGVESEMNIRYLDVDRQVPQEIYAGKPASIAYTVRNMRNASARLVLIDAGRSKISFLKRGGMESVRQERLFPDRGEYALGAVSVATTYPYGLFVKSIPFDLEDNVVVFPRPVACTPRAPFGPSGEDTGRERDSISHVRTYTPGDSFSQVVWKKQRLGFVSRVLQGGGGVGSLVVVTPGGDMEEKLGMATYLIIELWRSGLEFGVSINRYFSGMGSTPSHKREILSALALTEGIREPETKALPGHGHVIFI